ncbi:uncharacterized protein LOC144497861 [Mustelus asterias]
MRYLCISATFPDCGLEIGAPLLLGAQQPQAATPIPESWGPRPGAQSPLSRQVAQSCRQHSCMEDQASGTLGGRPDPERKGGGYSRYTFSMLSAACLTLVVALILQRKYYLRQN